MSAQGVNLSAIASVFLAVDYTQMFSFAQIASVSHTVGNFSRGK